MMTLHFNGTMTVADIKREFNTLFGAQVRLYDGNNVASLNASLSSIGLRHNGEMECQGETKIADFAKRVLNEFGIKLKVYTCDEWVAVLGELTLEMSGKVKRNAVKADMEKILANIQTSAKENILPTPPSDGRTEIVLNKMFSGSYLDDNIGHEIINLYKDDNGENYVYIQPYGTYSASHYNAVKYVMFVRTIEGHFSEEVLGVAEICADEYNPNYSEQSIKEHQEVLCDEIKYGGHSLTEIFSDNGVNVRQLVSVSMKARRVRLLDRKVYLVFEPGKNAAALRSIVPSDSIIIEMQTNYAKSSMKQYFEVGDADYKNLKELIENRPEIWTKESESINITDQVSQKEESFWDICRIGDYELAYSNALAYYMKKYPELVVRFAKERLGIETHSFGTNIQRELANVDIYMENDERIVVIENKITSKINGINVKDKSSTGSQLDKYYRYAMERAGGKKDVHCYLLSPNYNHINLKDYSFEGFDCEKIYKPLYYSDIYDFVQSLPDHPYKDFYFREYIKGIEKHTKQYHDDLFEETRRKFVKKLQSLE